MVKKFLATLMSAVMLFAFCSCLEDTQDNLSDSNANTKVSISVKSDTENQIEKASNPTQTAINNEENVDSANKPNYINSSVDSSIESGKTSTAVIDYSQDSESNIVWIPVNGGTKYHSKSTCSNMKNPVEVSKKTAIADGFSPCARCYRFN